MILKIKDVVALSVGKMLRNGVPSQEAERAAPIFLEGELWGKRTYGYRYLALSLEIYREARKQIQALTIERETAVSALLDGGFHFAPFVHDTAMKLAIEKAQVSGIAMVGVCNAGASGLLGYYSQLATEAGLIGIAINATAATVVPPGGVVPMLGTNPLSIGIPRTGQHPLILDMSTSAITYNRLLRAQREHEALPPGVAQDQYGNPTVDPFAAGSETYRSFILPFAGYKGFGLSFMIELLCDAGLGAAGGKSNGMSGPVAADACNGMYLAYRPDLFVERDVFDAQVAQWVADIKDSYKSGDETELRLPGEHSQRHKAKALQEGSIDIDESTYEFLQF